MHNLMKTAVALDASTQIIQTLVTQLENVTNLLHEIAKDERDDSSVGIFGWSECHQAIAHAREIIATVKAGNIGVK